MTDRVYGGSSIEEVCDRIEKHGQFIHREDAEKNADFVQIIPCALLTYNGDLFLFQRRETDPKYRLYGKTTILQGCHTTKQGSADIPKLLESALQDKISRSLFISRVFSIDPFAYCWERDDPKGRQHLGIIFRLNINNQQMAIDLKKKEFRKKRGHGLIGRFSSYKEIISSQDDLSLESWSRSIMLNYFGEGK